MISSRLDALKTALNIHPIVAQKETGSPSFDWSSPLDIRAHKCSRDGIKDKLNESDALPVHAKTYLNLGDVLIANRGGSFQHGYLVCIRSLTVNGEIDGCDVIELGNNHDEAKEVLGNIVDVYDKEKVFQIAINVGNCEKINKNCPASTILAGQRQLSWPVEARDNDFNYG